MRTAILNAPVKEKIRIDDKVILKLENWENAACYKYYYTYDGIPCELSYSEYTNNYARFNLLTGENITGYVPLPNGYDDFVSLVESTK